MSLRQNPPFSRVEIETPKAGHLLSHTRNWRQNPPFSRVEIETAIIMTAKNKLTGQNPPFSRVEIETG